MDTQAKREELGQHIATLRKEQGLTQARLGEMAGISRYHVWLIEHGQISFGIDVLYEISDALGESPGDLLEFR